MSKPELPKPKPTIILSWSGGIDSTSCLYQLVTAGEKVLAHHIVLKHGGNTRWIQERRAVMELQSWFWARRLEFDFVETQFDYGDLPDVARDILVTGFVAGVIAQQYGSIQRAVICSSLDDVQRQEGTNIQVLRMALTEGLALRKLEWIVPNAEKSKIQVMNELPHSLLKECWYCRRPDSRGRPCGQCPTCEVVIPHLKRLFGADWDA